MDFRSDNRCDEPSEAELLEDLRPYEHRLDHLVYLQERLREAAERESVGTLMAYA